MDRFEELNEFIDKAKKMTLHQAEQNDIEQYLKRKNYFEGFRKLPQFRMAIQKYENSEKGKTMRKRRASLKNEGKIAEFYRNRPLGHDVDHVIPLTLGGKHILENLQYLPSLLNHRKPKSYISTDMKVNLLRNRFIRKL